MKNNNCLCFIVCVSALVSLADAQVITEDTKLVANDGANSDGFSRSIAIDGELVVIGSPDDDDNGVNSGSAYLFDTTGVQISKLLSSNGNPFDTFGHSVATSDGVIAVGAFHADRFPDIIGGGDGAVYLFDSLGIQFAELVPTDPSGFFGWSVASDDGVIVVGANTDNEVGSEAGAAYLFDIQGVQLAKITATDGAHHDRFGDTVAVGDGIVAVASPLDDDKGLDSGSVYLFAPSGVQIAKLTADDGGEGDLFGGAIAIGSGVIAVGSTGSDYDGMFNAGAVYLYDLSGTQFAKVVPSNGVSHDRFGSSLSIDNGYLVVGARNVDQTNGQFLRDSGAAYLFDLQGRQVFELNASDASSDDYFGSTVAMHNGHVIIGATGDEDNGPSSGSAYLFDVACMLDLNIPRPVLLSSYSTPDLAREVVVIGETAYIADGASGLQILDVSDLEDPVLIGSYDSPGFSQDVAVVGSIAYVADGVDGGLLILDVSDPSSPAIINSYDTPGNAINLTVVGDLVYVADNNGGLLIFDVAIPSNPILLGSYGVPDAARSVEVIGTTAYLAAGPTGLIMLDISDPAAPTLLGEYDSPGYAQFIDVQGTTGYLADWTSGLRVLDLTNSQDINEIGSLQTENAGTIVIDKATAYLADGGAGLKIIDISNPISPMLVTTHDTPNFALDVFLNGENAFIADNNAGLQILAVDSCSSKDICAVDLNSDGSLDFFDVSAFLTAFGQQDPVADFTGDGSFDFFDVSAFLQAFSVGCP